MQLTGQEQRCYSIALAAAEGAPGVCATCRGAGMVPADDYLRTGDGFLVQGSRPARKIREHGNHWAPIRVRATICKECHGTRQA